MGMVQKSISFSCFFIDENLLVFYPELVIDIISIIFTFLFIFTFYNTHFKVHMWV